MKSKSGAFSPVIAVNRAAAKPMHRQLYDTCREAIVSGSLRPGQQIPSTRALASELGISRIPVLNAYAQLLAEGYFESRTGAGTFVSSCLPERLISCCKIAGGSLAGAASLASFQLDSAPAERTLAALGLEHSAWASWHSSIFHFRLGQACSPGTAEKSTPGCSTMAGQWDQKNFAKWGIYCQGKVEMS